MNIDKLIEQSQADIERYYRYIKEQNQHMMWLRRNRQYLERLPDSLLDKTDHSPGFRIDFNHLTHAETIQVIRAFGGKWDKKYDEDKINYTRRDEVDGLIIRVWQGEPPPFCKIVEVEVEVPAQAATTKKVKKVVCGHVGSA